ncbi:hypothetical protein NLJ89_g5680 [Agrocybe chaxingu]|uniref:Major facilitator superfamily (MFS) profile domain-containing protein n=1 Tax=Agrocybe chaxingu TaxID=84603 RepID=A0A9W8K0K2_9AGAR|nr:hypothetical protein NLJ89_g5680 [Agrocybe chaxingu]
MTHHEETHNEKTTSTSHSPNSSVTHVQVNEKQPDGSADLPALGRMVSNGHGESALPADKIEEALENLEEDWEDDPENARNWSHGRKWAAVSIPLLIAPLSEMYGRTWVLHICNLLTMAFCFGCAFAPDTGSLIAFRFLSGFTGSAPVACGGGSMGDLFAERDRAMAMALFSLGPLIGPVVGPVAGGFIAQSVGIKWVFIVIGIMCGLCSAIGIPVLKETYAPVIPPASCTEVRRPRGSRQSSPPPPSRSTAASCTFICFILSLYMSFMYGIFYLMFATFAALFRNTYGFKAGIGGLAYLGLGIGFVAATAFGAKVADALYKRLAAKNGGVATPEMRIPALFFGAFFVPIGLFWYGWSAQAKLHWIMPIIGSGIFGFGMMTTFLPINLYLVDSFTYAASATAASALFRSLLGFAFPLFGAQMFDALGMGGGNSLLAGLSIVLGIPFPIYIYFKGAELRARSVHTRESTIPKLLNREAPSATPRS